jgi:hypothetical protein
MVCTEIRRQYGTPVRQLKWVQNFMLKEGANHFEAAVKLMDLLGVGVWLCTDLEETFVLDSELEIIDMWEHGYFGAGCEKAFVFLPINPLVNRLLSCLKEPIELEAHGKGYEIMQAFSPNKPDTHPDRHPGRKFFTCLSPSNGQFAMPRWRLHMAWSLNASTS